MARFDGETTLFKRSRFLARFPTEYRYTASHFWLHEQESGRFRIGLTDFATRMLGEIVELDFEIEPGVEVQPGDVVGWMEGFKAVADLYCVARGKFLGANPAVLENCELICNDCYGEGWLYLVEGETDAEAMDVKGYASLLNETIDTMEEKPWQTGAP